MSLLLFDMLMSLSPLRFTERDSWSLEHSPTMNIQVIVLIVHLAVSSRITKSYLHNSASKIDCLDMRCFLDQCLRGMYVPDKFFLNMFIYRSLLCSHGKLFVMFSRINLLFNCFFFFSMTLLRWKLKKR